MTVQPIPNAVYVRGVRVPLTAQQIKAVEKELSARLRGVQSFASVLKSFGFKPLENTVGNYPGFTHAGYGWYAEVADHGCFQDCWLVGQGLKHGSFPGGWTYGTPEEVREAICNAIDQIENGK